MSTISVELPDAAYGISVRPGLLDEVGGILREFDVGNRCAIVTDTQVGPLYLDALTASLRSVDLEPIPVVIESGEQYKTLDTVRQVYDALLEARVERKTPLLALGGGVTTDLAGFAAATTLRGLPYMPIPTSLLAMVDASVGGKTGVNHDCGKNLIGAFYHPSAVLIDPAVLRSLPPEELRYGMAECIKHDVIRDAGGFARLEEQMPDLLGGNVEALSDLVVHNVVIKARVVEADPYEEGERAHLNFGHTFGHAIEKVTNFAVAHGEAVALGMAAAMHASLALKLIGTATQERVLRLIEAAGLPIRRPGLDVDAVCKAMLSDKKVKHGRKRFVLIDGLGHAIVRDDVPDAIVRDAVASLSA